MNPVHGLAVERVQQPGEGELRRCRLSAVGVQPERSVRSEGVCKGLDSLWQRTELRPVPAPVQNGRTGISPASTVT